MAESQELYDERFRTSGVALSLLVNKHEKSGKSLSKRKCAWYQHPSTDIVQIKVLSMMQSIKPDERIQASPIVSGGEDSKVKEVIYGEDNTRSLETHEQYMRREYLEREESNILQRERGADPIVSGGEGSVNKKTIFGHHYGVVTITKTWAERQQEQEHNSTTVIEL